MSAAFSFCDETHTYIVGNEEVPSVTQCLEEAGLCDIPDHPAALARFHHKADIGTELHLACRYYDEGDLDVDSLDTQVAGYFKGYVDFQHDTGFQPQLIEQRGIGEIGGMKYGYCLDRTGLIGKDLWLLDMKCSYKPMAHWPIQLTAYAMAHPADKLGVIHLFPTGKYKLIEYPPKAIYREVFVSCLKISWWKRGKP